MGCYGQVEMHPPIGAGRHEFGAVDFTAWTTTVPVAGI